MYLESLQQTDLPEYELLDLSFLFSQCAVSFTSIGNNIVCDPCNLRWVWRKGVTLIQQNLEITVASPTLAEVK
jgi:hypothetical protein